MAIHRGYVRFMYVNEYGYISSKNTAYKSVFYPIFCVFLVYTVVTFSLYLYRALRLRDKALLERSPFLVLIQTIFGSVFVIDALLHSAITNYPCFLNTWLANVGWFLWMASLLLNMVRYWVLVHSHRIFANEIRENPVKPNNLVEHLTKLQAIGIYGHWQDDSNPSASQNNSTRNANKRRKSSLSSVVSGIYHYITHIGTSTDNLKPSTVTEEDTGAQIEHPPQTINIAEVAPFAGPESTAIQISRQQLRQQCEKENALSAKPDRKAIWSKRAISNRFAALVLGIVFVLVFIMLVFFQIFIKRLQFKHIYYNCVRVWFSFQLFITSGIFNLIICPVFVYITRSYRDAYGIRNSIFIGSVIGILSWIGALVWRILYEHITMNISNALLFSAQIVAMYITFIFVPTIASIRFGRKQRKGTLDTARAQEQGYSESVLRQGVVKGDLSLQAFLVAMRDKNEHAKISEYAHSCFCTELITFLDVYLALKASIYLEINGKIAAAVEAERVSETNSSKRVSRSESYRPRISIIMPESARTSQILGLSSTATSQKEVKPQEASQRGSHSILSKLLELSRARDSAYSDSKRSRVAETISSAEGTATLSSLAPGVAETMAQVFPNQNIDDDSLVPEGQREALAAIIRTFVLPESPFAINTSSKVVSSARAYLDGDQMTFGTLDKVKDEVVNMLYSNVYLRYRRA